MRGVALEGAESPLSHPTRGEHLRSATRVAFADGLRGLAALWVVLFHASEGGHVRLFLADVPAWIKTAVFDWGHLGVAVFFVLSGYVMIRSVEGAPATAAFSARFMARRLVRLCPPYYAAIVFVVGYAGLKAAALSQVQPRVEVMTLLAHVAYLQDILSKPAISVVFWTLCIEIQFYVAFAAIHYLQGRLTRVEMRGATDLPWMVAGMISLPWAFGWPSGVPFPGSFFPFFYAFVLGVFVGMSGSSLRRPTAIFVVLLLIAWAVTRSSFVGASLGAGAVLLGAGAFRSLARALSSAPLQFLGLVSYSLYLIHNQVSGATAFVVRRFVGDTVHADVAVLVAMVVASVGAAWIFWRCIEKPSISWSRGIKLSTRAEGR